jgi:glucose dehydrogenase
MDTLTNLLTTAVWLFIAVVIGTTLWVRRDIRRWHLPRSQRIGWILGVLLLWVVFFPRYLRARPAHLASGKRIDDANEYAAYERSLAQRSAKAATEAQLVCPHCQNRGAVTTGEVYDYDPRGSLRTRRCSTCDSKWTVVTPLYGNYS